MRLYRADLGLQTHMGNFDAKAFWLTAAYGRRKRSPFIKSEASRFSALDMQLCSCNT